MIHPWRTPTLFSQILIREETPMFSVIHLNFDRLRLRLNVFFLQTLGSVGFFAKEATHFTLYRRGVVWDCDKHFVFAKPSVKRHRPLCSRNGAKACNGLKKQTTSWKGSLKRVRSPIFLFSINIFP